MEVTFPTPTCSSFQWLDNKWKSHKTPATFDASTVARSGPRREAVTLQRTFIYTLAVSLDSMATST